MSNRVKLQWENPNSRSSKIFIYKSRKHFTKDTLPEVFHIIDDSNVTEYHDNNVREGETYYYIIAVGEGYNRTYSETITVDILYKNSEPFNLVCTKNQNGLQLSWRYDRIFPEGFNIYVSNSPIDIDFLELKPVAKSSNIGFLYSVSGGLNEHQRNYFRVSIIKDRVEYFSNEVIYFGRYPYDIAYELSSNGLMIDWVYEGQDFEQFKLYISDAPIDENNLPQAIESISETSFLVTGIQNFNLRKYVRIAVVVDGVEYLSKESSFYALPFNIDTIFQNNALSVEWDISHELATSYNYYVSSVSFNASNKPQALYSNLVAPLCLDQVSPMLGRKYIRIGAVINGIEYLSEEYIYWYENPYNLNTSLIDGKVNITFKHDLPVLVDTCNIYASDNQINAYYLPEPLYSGVMINNYQSQFFRKYNKKFFRVGVVIDDKEYLSDEVIFKHSNIFDFSVGLVGGNLLAQWACELEGAETYKIYHDLAPINTASLPVAKVTGISDLHYEFDDLDIHQKRYFRVSTLINGVEVVSDQFEYDYLYPHGLNVQINNQTLQGSWLFNQTFPQGFKYFCEEQPFTAFTLPSPKEIGIPSKNFTDTGHSIYGRKYMMVGIDRGGKTFASNLFVHRYPTPYQLSIDISKNVFAVNWLSDFETGAFEQYKLYCENATISTNAMPLPKKANIKNLSEVVPNIPLQGVKYVRVGVVVNGVERYSDEIIYRYPTPYSLSVALDSGAIKTTWISDYVENVTFNYYISDESMSVGAMPSAIAVGLTDSNHLDVQSVIYGEKYIRVSSIIDGVERYSDEIVFTHYDYIPYSIQTVSVSDGVQIDWLAHSINGATYNIYLESAPIDILVNTPKATEVTGLSYLYQTTEVMTECYIRICAVVDGVEYLSEEQHIVF